LAILELELKEYDSRPLVLFQLVREKTFIMIFYEILFRRLPAKVVKETLEVRV
jgi:hypothetical protein